MKKNLSEMNESELNEAFGDFKESYIDKIEKEQKRLDRYVKKLKYTPVSLRLKFYDKVYKKYNSESYINKEYKLGREPMNLLYDIILEFAIHNMPYIGDNDGNSIYLVDDAYVIQIIYGQGSYIRFEKIDKNKLPINALIKSDLYKYKFTYNKSETIDESSNNWRHYELADCHGLVAYSEKFIFDNKEYKHLLIVELVEDDGYWSFSNREIKFDSAWLNEKIKLYESMNEWIINYKQNNNIK